MNPDMPSDYATIDPSNVSIDISNNIIILDKVNRKIKKYSSTGAWLMTIGERPDYGNVNNPDIAPLPNQYVRTDLNTAIFS